VVAPASCGSSWRTRSWRRPGSTRSISTGTVTVDLLNHCCEPKAERLGFVAVRPLAADDEVTFDERTSDREALGFMAVRPPAADDEVTFDERVASATSAAARAASSRPRSRLHHTALAAPAGV
jgi:hypothetical protein